MSDADARHIFLMQFDPDVRRAEEKYAALRSKLVFYFQQNGGSDPANLADEVFFRALRRFAGGAEAYAGINAYCYGIAENVLREDRRRPRGEELPDEMPLKRMEPHAALNRPEKRVLVEEFLRDLPGEDRALIERYFLDDREELARDLNVSQNGLRIRVFRIRQRLLEKVSQAGRRAATVMEIK